MLTLSYEVCMWQNPWAFPGEEEHCFSQWLFTLLIAQLGIKSYQIPATNLKLKLQLVFSNKNVEKCGSLEV